jgi:hypothetical protein
MPELKLLSKEAIPAAMARVERYRLLNEPEQAESICLDILRCDADNQEAIIALLLAITDQFANGTGPRVSEARELLPRLRDEYERAYYAGIISERRARALLNLGGPGSGFIAYEWIRRASGTVTARVIGAGVQTRSRNSIRYTRSVRRNFIEGLMLSGLAASCLPAGQIILPSHALERDAVVNAVYRTNRLATGKGELTLNWTDAHGRLVDDRKIPVELIDEDQIGFSLDLRRASAIKNTLHAHFAFEGRNRKGEPDKREEDAEITFIARPPGRQWRDYMIMMWQQYDERDARLLKTLGINGGQYLGRNETPPDFLLNNDLRWYAENIATDFYAAYHRWFPDRPVNWLFREAKDLYKKDPTGKQAFKRRPSLSDPVWLEKIHDRLVESVKRYSPYRPVFYDLGDESGIADLAAAWDFDFSDESLVPMRRWLRERYGTLAALNQQWGTNFANWDVVMPLTTDEAMKRSDDNFSAWADFKEWMDIAFSSALKMGVDAVRSADPDAYAGIAGGQMPGWGGYDYSRIAKSVNAIEPYDIGNNIEILRSINPGIAVITTAFATGPWEKHRVWYELLHGNRGLIIWDDKNGFITKDGAVGERGRESAPYYNEIRNGNRRAAD